jgi:DNA anti-recombination protein RmuC
VKEELFRTVERIGEAVYAEAHLARQNRILPGREECFVDEKRLVELFRIVLHEELEGKVRGIVQEEFDRRLGTLQEQVDQRMSAMEERVDQKMSALEQGLEGRVRRIVQEELQPVIEKLDATFEHVARLSEDMTRVHKRLDEHELDIRLLKRAVALG